MCSVRRYRVQAARDTIEALDVLLAREMEWQLLMVDVLQLGRAKPPAKGIPDAESSEGSCTLYPSTNSYSSASADSRNLGSVTDGVANGAAWFRKALQARGVGSPFVVLGSRSQRSLLERAVAHGATSMLLRPICVDDLAALWKVPLMHVSLGEGSPKAREEEGHRQRDAASVLSAQLGRFWSSKSVHRDGAESTRSSESWGESWNEP